ncbi:pre-peptidase C-terminal domain-containing protein [Nostoc ellipsosporum NOK]|nr:pre-peptidase C-terminal domain-containing protein [Nostoc ellipsosporum NOK]
MKRSLLLLSFALTTAGAAFAQQSGWRRATSPTNESALFNNRYRPASYSLLQLDAQQWHSQIRQAPSETTISARQSSFIINLPDENGQMLAFRVVEAPVMDPALAARYPGIQSYAGTGVTDPSQTVRFSTGTDGLHGMILRPGMSTVYIDPVGENEGYYVSFARSAALGDRHFSCETPESAVSDNPPLTAGRAADDGRLRTYRLALASTGEYSQYFLNGTETTDAQRKAKVLTAMNTAMTRANAIYERDMGIRMVLIANNDAIIYLTASTDPWTSEYNIKTQQTIDAVIGNANYDIGHLVHRGSNNGNAGCIACVCKTHNGSTNPNTFVGKGGAFTSHTAPVGDPFVVDYLTHEMGHQFGANHTFTFSNESGTASQFEPGSGSTIMGYAGITGATDVQSHSDDYFHARSIEQVSDYIKSSTGGGACAAVTVTGNTAPVANAGADYVIPRSTPFTLTGSATDVNAGNVLTYTWEQMNAGTSSTTNPSTTATSGPLFRSRTGTTDPSRTFPILSSILDGTNGNQWERLPGVARTLNFRLMVRDNNAGGGNTKDDDMVVTVNGSAGPFAVTAPNTAVTWSTGSSQTVTWSVNNTNVSPISCANVKISLSTDGGLTFPIVLAASTPNDGSETITVPANTTSTARIKVEAVGNIFFDISNVNFTITGGSSCAAPGSLTSSSVTASGATVSWAAVSGAVNYTVEYKTTAASTWTTAAASTTATSVSIGSLTAATTYDWRVRTNCSGGSSAYSAAQFTTTGSSGCVSAYESNETTGTAASIPVNTVVSAAIGSSTDVDYYSFVVSSTSNLAVTLSNLPGDYDLYLYNSGGTQIGSSTASGTSNESISLSSQAAGTYYIRVIGYSGAFSTSVCYNLNAGVTAVSSSCPGTYDVSTNGTYSGAATIPLNTDVKGTISAAGDVDYYRFVITTGGTATVTLSTLPADYDLRLYSSNGTSQLAISQNGGTSSETISRTFTAGTYFVQVYGYNSASNASNCYTLRVTTGTASRPGEMIAGEQRPEIYPNPVVRSTSVNLKGLKGKAELSVLDAQGKQLWQTSTSQSLTEIDMQQWTPGLYLLRVRYNGKEETFKLLKQ